MGDGCPEGDSKLRRNLFCALAADDQRQNLTLTAGQVRHTKSSIAVLWRDGGGWGRFDGIGRGSGVSSFDLPVRLLVLPDEVTHGVLGDGGSYQRTRQDSN